MMSEDELLESKIFSLCKYKCSFAGCKLEFRRKDRLDTHEYTHGHVKKFKCTEENCGKTYINNSHLQRHKKTAHSKSNEIVHCTNESCNEYFPSEAKMRLHCREIHSEKSREFECDICNEKFRRKALLRQHIFIHTGNYRYTCDKCGKGFLLLSRLKRHEKSHQNRKCDSCDATFEKWSLLLAHKQNVHSTNEHKCSICDKEFHSKRGLKAHRKMHPKSDDQTVYQCSFEGCAKIFSQKKNMLAHYKSKHENRKFACTFDGCKSELSTKQKLKHHIKVIHLNEGDTKQTKQPKTGKAERKDKGVQKVSTASKLFNIILPSEFEQAIIAGQGKNIHISYNRIEDEDCDQTEDSSNLAVAQMNPVNLAKEGVVKC